jgi:hypothetical protein
MSVATQAGSLRTVAAVSPELPPTAVARIIIPAASAGTGYAATNAPFASALKGVKLESPTCAPVTGASMETSSWIGSSAWKPAPVSVAVSPGS